MHIGAHIEYNYYYNKFISHKILTVKISPPRLNGKFGGKFSLGENYKMKEGKNGEKEEN